MRIWLMNSVSAASALTGLFPSAAFTQAVSRVQNNYSYILPGMPNYGIAQGSIFDIFGSNLATATSTLQSVPLPTALNGTSVSITVGGTTTQAILYFVSATQIAAILPSATPVGMGLVRVTVNGKTGPPADIAVVQSAFGMLTLNGVGNGPASAFDVNSQYLGLTNAANPGDFVTLWGSGVGPVSGDETVAQIPVNLTNIPLQVNIGGTAASVQYAGRSAYPGLDQINVQVPAGVSGCHVSVVVRSGDIVSNFGTIPVASNGRTCSESVTDLTASKIQALLSQPTINRGVIDFYTGGVSGQGADVAFYRFTNAQYATKQPGGSPSFGNCIAYQVTGPNQAIANPIHPVGLDAGSSIRLTTPSGSGFGNQTLPFDNGGYSISGLMANGSLKGTYTFSGSGGADIGAFTAQVTWPGGGSGFAFSTPNNPTGVTRSQGLTVTWTQINSGNATQFIEISGLSNVSNAPVGGLFVCNVPISAGRFSIPPEVLLALPPQGSTAAYLEIDVIIQQDFTAPGADLGGISFVFGSAEPYSYQ